MKITEWHFDTPNLITDVLRGEMTIDDNHYKIVLGFRYADPGLTLSGYDFGEFGRGGDIPIT